MSLRVFDRERGALIPVENRRVRFHDLRFDERWVLDVERLRDRIRPETKLVSVTYPHNPTGAVISESTLTALVDVAEKSGVTLVVDETYRELAYHDRLPLAASLSSSVVRMSSMSKFYGLPGLRIGWAVCDDPAAHRARRQGAGGHLWRDAR